MVDPNGKRASASDKAGGILVAVATFSGATFSVCYAFELKTQAYIALGIAVLAAVAGICLILVATPAARLFRVSSSVDRKGLVLLIAIGTALVLVATLPIVVLEEASFYVVNQLTSKIRVVVNETAYEIAPRSEKHITCTNSASVVPSLLRGGFIERGFAIVVIDDTVSHKIIMEDSGLRPGFFLVNIGDAKVRAEPVYYSAHPTPPRITFGDPDKHIYNQGVFRVSGGTNVSVYGTTSFPPHSLRGNRTAVVSVKFETSS